jgi:hypothetical protein
MFEELWMCRSWNTKNAGRSCGAVRPDGYIEVGVLGGNYTAHRLAWLWMTGDWPTGHIDHINGNRTDNRWSNLRITDHAGNAQNRSRPNRNNKVGLLGVCPEGATRFGAKIRVNGVRIWLGAFDTPEEAHGAYIKAKRDLHKGCTT